MTANLNFPGVPRVPITQLTLALILLLSGFCSLVYQTVWLREFRLVFGGAAPAAAAVVAVFMGGLGFGGKFFGARVERVGRPFRFYALLEAGIAVTALLSPVIMGLARWLYLKTGGTAGMGLGLATFLQLIMTVLALGVPCFLMGGALPAAMKFVQRDDDPRRSITAFFYGINIVGAVSGALLGTFGLLPNLGNQATLTTAGLVNFAIALTAGAISWFQEKEPRKLADLANLTEEMRVESKSPTSFVLGAAFMSGFTFFLAELVWYRMSTPLLGGSMFGFGLVLCVVLAGMGLGGLLYSLILKKVEPSLGGFTLVSALQALAVLMPYALGDRIAHLALILNDSLRGLGLSQMALGWAVVMSLLAFLPSLLSGIQFPLLVSLLGRGNTGVGQQLGQAYLWNTFGSISGSLLGGFLLVPLIGVKNCWLLAAWLIATMSAASLWLQIRPGIKGDRINLAEFCTGNRSFSIAALLACFMGALWADGPTSMWMHTPIGYGRVSQDYRSALGLETWRRTAQRALIKAYDGRETSVAVVSEGEYGFLTNGKSDGSAISDASTQVMLGIAGAALHPSPQRACVVGLGTGTTAGWLADVPGMQRVDALELEKEIRKVARFFDPVSRGAMSHPRINHITGDAREFLLTKGENYDLIVSEPSNPCRAGVANLYTREFYLSASQRLTSEGIFCQWLQGYEVEPSTINIVITTLQQVFPKVEVWATQDGDMLLICTNQNTPWKLESLRQRVKEGVIAEALRRFWNTNSAEGFLSNCLANSDYCAAIAVGTKTVNTDDMNLLEFNFARSVAKKSNCSLDLALAATQAGCYLPKVDAPMDSPLYLAERLHMPGRLWKMASTDLLPAEAPPEVRLRAAHLSTFWQKRYADYLKTPAPVRPVLGDQLRLARAKAICGTPDALAAIDAIASLSVADAHFLRAINCHVQQKPGDFLRHIEQGLDSLMKEPWCQVSDAVETLNLISNLSKSTAAVQNPRFYTVFEKLDRNYPVNIVHSARLRIRCEMAMQLPLKQQLAAVASFADPYPWDGRALVLRANAYQQTGDPRFDAAMDDLNRYLDQGGKVGGETPPFVFQLSAPVEKTARAKEMVVGGQAGH
jgi:spermidine synthase